MAAFAGFHEAGDLGDFARDGAGGVYTESGVAGVEPVPGHALMARLLERST